MDMTNLIKKIFNMKRNVFLICMMALLVGSSFSPVVKPKFEIEIIQNDESLDIDENMVTLEKAPFSIQVKCYEMDGVFMNASFEEKLFELGQDGKLVDFAFISSKTMTEDPANKNKELIVTNGYYSFMANDEAHSSFDQIETGEGYFTGTKSVEKLYDKAADKALTIKKNKKDIYLFFVATTPDHKTELGRYRLKIQWD